MDCSVDGCGGKTVASGLCNKHYLRKKKFGDPLGGARNHAPPMERFWRFVDKDGHAGCWYFICGRRNGAGHGKFQPGGKGSSGVQAHRWLYAQINGPIPAGLVVMHSCDNMRCVNPDHLSLGTPKENTQDMIRKGRAVWVAPLGEENGKSVLTEAQVCEIKASGLTNAELARKLSVSPNTIRGVRTGRTWTHVK